VIRNIKIVSSNYLNSGKQNKLMVVFKDEIELKITRGDNLKLWFSLV